MSELHDLVLKHGREAARQMVNTKHEKLAVDMAADILAEECDRMGITHSGFCLTALPHRRQVTKSHGGETSEQTIWRKEGHRVTLLVESGHDRDMAPIGIPYGPKARIQLIYLQTKAIQTGSPIVEMGGSMHEWFTRVGITGGGAQYREVREQSRRISACRLTFLEESDVAEIRHNGAFVENAITFKDNADHRQGSLWQDTVELNATFFKKLKEHPVPIWEPALRQISSKSMTIDIYIWLSYRLHVIEKPTPISWLSLFSQFGSSFSALKHFKPEFVRNLTFALAVYPEARIEENANGLVLYPSPSPIPSNTVSLAGIKGLGRQITKA